MEASGASIDLYCDKEGDDLHGWGEMPHQFTSPITVHKCRKKAKQKGWVFHRNGTHTCPRCAKDLGLHTRGAT